MEDFVLVVTALKKLSKLCEPGIGHVVGGIEREDLRYIENVREEEIEAKTEGRFIYKYQKREQEVPNEFFAVMEERKKFSSIIEALKALYVYKPFSCGGQVDSLDDTVRLKIKSIDGKEVDCGPFDNLDVEELIKHCQPAPFGDLKTQQTVFDPSVRVAFECDASKLVASSDSNPQIELGRLVSSLSKTLREIFFQDKDTYVQLVPYKLNVYSPGGFFKQHIDTPTDPEKMVGTLVLSLPTPHKGGELIVTHGGSAHVFDFSQSSLFQWAAFYSDCIHEVKHVTEGHRVTLTFSMILSEDRHYYYGKIRRINSLSPPSPNQTNTLINGLVKCIEDTQFTQMGILLSYKYTYKGISFANLKGSDKAICDALGLKWNCKLLPVMYRFQAGLNDEDEFMDRQIYSFAEEDLMYLLGRAKKPPVTYQNIPFVKIESGVAIQHSHDEGAEYTGNSSRPETVETIYFNAALIITKDDVTL